MWEARMKYFAVILCTSIFSATFSALAQQSMAGKICVGTFTIGKDAQGDWDLGAFKISFEPSAPNKATVLSAPGKDSFDDPEHAEFVLSSPVSDVSFAGNQLKFANARGAKFNLTGDGVSFSGMVDPRPTRRSVAEVKLRCK